MTASASFVWVYWTCFFVASALRSIHSRRHPHSLPKLEKVELPGMLLSFLGMAIFPLMYTLTDWLDFADYNGNLYMGIIGAIGMMLSVSIIGKAHNDLGSQWTHTPKQVEQATMVTKGIYASIRHPMYTAHFLWGVSQALLLWNGIAGFGFLFGLLVFCPLRLRLEEANLRRTFGEAYLAYESKTPRFIPWR